MTKKDLRTGMVVEVRSGDKYTVILNAHSVLYHDDILTNLAGGFMRLSNYQDDLSHILNDDFDIIRVFEHLRLGALLNFDDMDMKVLWEREHTPKVGDIYKSELGNKCIITKVNGTDCYLIWNDGSCGIHSKECITDGYKFTGKTVESDFTALLKELKGV